MEKESNGNELEPLAQEQNGSAGVGGPNTMHGLKSRRSDMVDDLAQAAELTDKGLMQQLKERYQQDVIYVRIFDTLLLLLL